MKFQGEWPACCREIVKTYVGINSKEYPREGAALFCPHDIRRLTYTDGVWHRDEPPALPPEDSSKKIRRQAKNAGLRKLYGGEGGDLLNLIGE